LPEKAEANVNVIELLLLYIISPITTFSELSTTVTDGNFSIVCVMFHVVAAED
jgi:predicted permease